MGCENFRLLCMVQAQTHIRRIFWLDYVNAFGRHINLNLGYINGFKGKADNKQSEGKTTSQVLSEVTGMTA